MTLSRGGTLIKVENKNYNQWGRWGENPDTAFIRVKNMTRQWVVLEII